MIFFLGMSKKITKNTIAILKSYFTDSLSDITEESSKSGYQKAGCDPLQKSILQIYEGHNIALTNLNDNKNHNSENHSLNENRSILKHHFRFVCQP